MQSYVLENVKSALVKTLNLKQEKNIDLNTKLKDELGLDSMSSLTFLIALEENIKGFIVDPDTLDADHLISVKTVIEYVKSELTRKNISMQLN